MSGLNIDFSIRAVMRTSTMDWQASPGKGVWRKRLELLGPVEAGRVTSVVRYDAGSRFPPHPHPDGEEIFVLEGEFCDEHGRYPAGYFLLNPEGFVHAPFSDDGCVLFVKLRQYPGSNRRHVAVDTSTAVWSPADTPESEVITLYAEPMHPETVHMLRMAPGSRTEFEGGAGGWEIFVLEGSMEDAEGHYPRGTWLRLPGTDPGEMTSAEGCTLYVKAGHLPPAPAD